MANTPSEKGSPPVAGKSSAPVSQSGEKLPLERLFGRGAAEWFRDVETIWKVITGIGIIVSLLLLFGDYLGKKLDERSTYALQEWWHDFGKNKIVEIDSEVKKPRFVFSLDRLKDDRLSTRNDVEESIYDLKVLYFWDNSERYSQYDWNEILTWLKESAEQGYAEAQNTLGVLYWNGWEVEEDENVAVQWWDKAANQNSKYAQHNLAVYHWRNSLDRNNLYRFSQQRGKRYNQKVASQKERNRSKSEAIHYWKKSSSQGLAAAQYNLANIHWDKIGTSEEIPQNVEEAIRLYEEASEQGHLKSRFYLSRAHISRKYLELNKSKFVNDWKNLADLDNNEGVSDFLTYQVFEKLASYNFGVTYTTDGEITKKNFKKSERRFQRASFPVFYGDSLVRLAHVDFMLGNIYLSIFQKTTLYFFRWTGLPDLLEYFGYASFLSRQAEHSYQTAHQENYTPAQYALAFFYWEGKNGRRNREKAVRLFKIAAGPTSKLDALRSPYKNNNYCLAQHALGLVYWSGKGGEEKNRDKAYHWLEKSAAQGLAESYYYLARYHYDKFTKDNSDESAQQNLKDSYRYYIVSRDLGYAYKHTQKQGEKIRKILEKKMIDEGEGTKEIGDIKKKGKKLADDTKKMKVKNCTKLK